jgi:hypothetical protein
LTRAQTAQVDSAPQSRALTARVGRIADVIVGRSCGIDFDLQIGGFLPQEMPQYSFGRGTAADVAEADE